MRTLCSSLILVALFTGLAAAQTLPKIERDKGLLTWEWTAGPSGPATEFRVKCGWAPGSRQYVTPIPATALSAPVRQVTPATGTFYCVVTAVDADSESEESNEVGFRSYQKPPTPKTLTVSQP